MIETQTRDRVMIWIMSHGKANALDVELLQALSRQIAIAVENMLAYTSLQNSNRHLLEEKQFLLTHGHEYQSSKFVFVSSKMNRIMQIVDQVAETVDIACIQSLFCVRQILDRPLVAGDHQIALA